MLTAHIRSDHIFATVRRASGLGGRSLLEIAGDGDAPAVLSLVHAMFAFDDANSASPRSPGQDDGPPSFARRESVNARSAASFTSGVTERSVRSPPAALVWLRRGLT